MATKRILAHKSEYYDREAFIDSLRRMRQQGGPRQLAAEKVLGIIGAQATGLEVLSKLTKHGESRIPHCIKYDLNDYCRLVTAENENAVWFLIEDHDGR